MTARIGDQPTSRFVTVAGVRLHGVDWGGSGYPLVLVHGGRRTGRSWDAVARRLRGVFRVIAFDARGHGDSDIPPTGYADTDRVVDLTGYLDGLEIASAFAVGHSLGGATVALQAVAHPERVPGLVLIEPVTDGPIHWRRVGVLTEDGREAEGRSVGGNRWDSLDELRERLLRNRMTKDWAPEVLEDVLRGETRALPDGGGVEMKWHHIAYSARELSRDTFSLLRQAPRLTMPVLIMAAASNGHLATEIEPLARALPQGELMAVPDVGHNIYMEAPDLVAEAIRRFLLRGT